MHTRTGIDDSESPKNMGRKM